MKTSANVNNATYHNNFRYVQCEILLEVNKQSVFTKLLPVCTLTLSFRSRDLAWYRILIGCTGMFFNTKRKTLFLQHSLTCFLLPWECSRDDFWRRIRLSCWDVHHNSHTYGHALYVSKILTKCGTLTSKKYTGKF